jgi:hypothetical protein
MKFAVARRCFALTVSLTSCSGVPKVPISFGSGAGEDWIALDRTGNTRAGKLLACFALATKKLKFWGFL